MMKHSVDGDQLCITLDDFINLQESPAMFYPLASQLAQTVLNEGMRGLPLGELFHVRDLLAAQQRDIAQERAGRGESVIAGG